MINEDFYVKIDDKRIMKALNNHPEFDLTDTSFFARDLLVSTVEAMHGDGVVLCGKRTAGFVSYWYSGGDYNEKQS